MVNALNVHSDSIRIKTVNVKEWIPHADFIMLTMENVLAAMMDINLTNKDVKKMRQQYLIQTVQNGEMENVQKVHLDHFSDQMEYVN